MNQIPCNVFFPGINGGEVAINFFEMEGVAEVGFEKKPAGWKEGDPVEVVRGCRLTGRSGIEYLIAVTAREYNDICMKAVEAINAAAAKSRGSGIALPSSVRPG
jgi:hypothetical protein